MFAGGNADVRDGAARTGSEDAAGGGAPGEMGDFRCERRFAGGAGGDTSIARDDSGEAA